MTPQTLRLTDCARMPGERDDKLQEQKTTPQLLNSTARAQMSEPHHSDLPEETMASPTLTSTSDAQISERRHSDPPALWIALTLASIAIHVVALGMLRLFLIAGFPGWRLDMALIPVDVIALAPEATSSPQPNIAPSSTATRIPTPPNTPTNRKSNQGSNSRNVSPSNPSSSPANSQPSNTPKGEPNQFQNESPVPPSSQNQEPGTPTSQTTPESTPDNGTQPGGSTPPSNPNPVPPVDPSGGQTAPNSQQGGGQQGGGFARLAQPTLISNQNEVLYTDRGDQAATLQQNSAQLSSDDLKSLGISLEQVVELKVVVLIDSTGKANVYPDSTQVLQGTISPDKAEQLARAIVERSRFNATVMAGQPVDRDYYLTLTINPSEN